MIPRLLYVTDGKRGTAGRPLAEVIEDAVAGGLDAVLLREFALADDSLVRLVRHLDPLRAGGLRILISRRLDVARSLDLDGVQLAADAVPVATARDWLGPDAWIGVSAHGGEEARAAAEAGASFVTLSPIYATASKPGLPGRGLEWLSEESRGLAIPVLALGGVTPERTRGILAAGAWGVAAVAAIGAAPDVAAATRRFRDRIREHEE